MAGFFIYIILIIFDTNAIKLIKVKNGLKMSIQFDFVSVKKKPNIHYNGRSISYIIQCQDGSQKTLGVILPSEKPMIFQTHVAEYIEIISGTCQVRVGDAENSQTYEAGGSFHVPALSRFSMQSNELVDYVCHLEK